MARSNTIRANAELIKQRRLARGWSQQRLAEEAEVDRARVVEIENGKPLSPQTIERIVKKLDLSLAQVTDGLDAVEFEGFMALIRRAAPSKTAEQRLVALPQILAALGVGCLLFGFWPTAAFPAFAIGATASAVALALALAFRQHVSFFCR